MNRRNGASNFIIELGGYMIRYRCGLSFLEFKTVSINQQKLIAHDWKAVIIG
jgi:hypothetical protein